MHVHSILKVWGYHRSQEHCKNFLSTIYIRNRNLYLYLFNINRLYKSRTRRSGINETNTACKKVKCNIGFPRNHLRNKYLESPCSQQRRIQKISVYTYIDNSIINCTVHARTFKPPVRESHYNYVTDFSNTIHLAQQLVHYTISGTCKRQKQFIQLK